MARGFRVPAVAEGAADPPRVSARRARHLLVRVLGLARPEWPRLAAGLFFLLLSTGGSVALPQGVKRIVDGALAAGGDAATLDGSALVLLAIFLVQGVASALRFILFSSTGERVVARLRTDLFAHLLEQDVAFFDTARTGELASTLASDTTLLQNAVSVNISVALRNAALALGSAVMLLYTSPRLTLVMLAVVPATAVGAVVYGRRLRRLSREVQDAVAASAAVTEESVANLRTVRAFAAEALQGGRYREAVARSLGLAERRIRASGVFMGAAMTLGFGSLAVVFWYGGRLVVAGRMTPGDLSAFLVYTLAIGLALGALVDIWADFMRSAGAAERIFELLDRRPTIPLTGGAELPVVTGRVEFDRVRFAYPGRPDVTVLHDLTLTIAPGELVAVVGASGAGKSTLAALLCRFYDPLEGAVRLDGHDLRALDPSWLRRRIGVVAQEPVLFSSTIAENIRYGRPDAADAEVEAAARAANAHDFIRRFPDGYATAVGERGVQLSGGQKQRVAIARALLKDPRLLILDEATSALDAESEHLVKEALERLLEGRTTLVIAHRLSTIAHADRVLVLEHGRIAQAGTHAELLAQGGIYKRLVERQAALA